MAQEAYVKKASGAETGTICCPQLDSSKTTSDVPHD